MTQRARNVPMCVVQEVKEVEVEQTTTKGRGNRSKSKKPKIPQSLTTGTPGASGVDASAVVAPRSGSRS